MTGSLKVHRKGPCALTSQAGLAVPSLGRAALFHEGGIYRGYPVCGVGNLGTYTADYKNPVGKKYDVMP